METSRDILGRRIEEGLRAWEAEVRGLSNQDEWDPEAFERWMLQIVRGEMQRRKRVGTRPCGGCGRETAERAIWKNGRISICEICEDGLGLSALAVEVGKRMGWSQEELDHAVVRMISAAMQVLTDFEHLKPPQPWAEPS